MWKVLKYSKTGEQNKEQGLRCQDYVYYSNKDSVQAITLADGSGESNYARIGAEHTCKILAELLAKHFSDLYEMDKALTQFNVITNIQSELYEICEKYDVKLQSLHSTFLGIAIDNEQNRFIAVHLGDGRIGIRQGKQMRIMSYPENGANRSQTFLTSAHKIGNHIQVYKDEIKDIREFILISDGWDEKISKNGRFFPKEILTAARESVYKDDVSLIALARE